MRDDDLVVKLRSLVSQKWHQYLTGWSIESIGEGRNNIPSRTGMERSRRTTLKTNDAEYRSTELKPIRSVLKLSIGLEDADTLSSVYSIPEFVALQTKRYQTQAQRFYWMLGRTLLDSHLALQRIKYVRKSAESASQARANLQKVAQDAIILDNQYSNARHWFQGPNRGLQQRCASSNSNRWTRLILDKTQ